MLEHGLRFEGLVRAGTAFILLFVILGLCFALGGYQIYRAWSEHQGMHGPHEAPPLGLPDAPNSLRRMRLDT